MKNLYAELLRYLKHLGRIRVSSSNLELDFQNNSELTTLYALDTNVVTSILHMEEGHFRLLPDDDKIQTLLVKMLTLEYIFERLPGDNPLLVLRGHDEELAGFFEDFARRWNDTQEREAELLSIIKSSDHNEMKSAGEELLSILIQRKIEKIFVSAVDSKKVLPINSSKVSEASRDLLIISNALRRNVNSKFYSEEQRMKLRWRERIEQRISKMPANKASQRRKTMRADVAALTSIESINAAVVDYGFKIVLLTFDDVLISVSNDYNEYFEAHFNNSSFAQEYVQSPVSLLELHDLFGNNLYSASTSVDSRQNEIDLNISDLIDLYFAPLINNDRRSSRVKSFFSYDNTNTLLLESIVRDVVNADNHHGATNIRKIVSEIIQHKTPKDYSEFLIEIKNSASPNDFERARETLPERYLNISHGSDVSFEELISSAMTFGVYFATQMEGNLHRFRMVPPIFFSSFEKTNQLVSSIVDGKVEGFSFEQTIEKLSNLRDEDPTLYATYIAISVIFGSVGLYRVALLCSLYAIAIADNPTCADQNISGREAQFLTSYFERILANSKKEILSSRQRYGLQFLKCMEIDRSRLGGNDGNFEAIIEIRNMTEDLSAKAHMYFFNIIEGKGRDAENVTNLKSIMDSMAGVFEYVCEIERVADSKYQWVVSRCKRSISINYLSLNFLLHCMKMKLGNSVGFEEFSTNRADIRSEFVRHVLDIRGIDHDCVSQSILSAAAVCIALCEAEGQKNIDDFDQLSAHLREKERENFVSGSFAKFEARRIKHFNENIGNYAKEFMQ